MSYAEGVNERAETFFQDLKSGQKYISDSALITEAAIKSFAAEFDPQQFHLDDAWARQSLFQGLAASGWHTAAISMRLFVTRMNFAGGAIGLGVDDLKWPIAVRVGDELSVETEILELRESRSRDRHGILKFRNITRNQRGEIVQQFVASALVTKRESPVTLEQE